MCSANYIALHFTHLRSLGLAFGLANWQTRPAGMHSGMSMGHEFMGIVESTGPNVKSVKVGDRAVSAFDIACGQCFFCEKARFGCAGRFLDKS